MPEGYSWLAVACGDDHTCGITTDGETLCWGASDRGQANVIPGDRWVQIDAGWQHNCVIDEDGYLGCFGWNESGQADVPSVD